MFEISKEFHFSASHVLEGLPEGHPCGRLHGHNYIVKVVLSSPVLDETGFVLDFGELSKLKAWIDDTLDHRHLNDVLSFNPTAENLAKWIYDVCDLWWPGYMDEVHVSETPKTWATYWGGGSL